MSQCEELEGSELGTQSYWNNTYKLEIKNFSEHGDVGEVWFGEDAFLRVLSWLRKQEETQQLDTDASIIDLGCGNGMTLLELAREGYTDLTGVDYSKPAVELAAAICKEEFPDIKYKVLDILQEDITDYKDKYKIVHDKGTYDAISLNPDDPKTKRCLYIQRVSEMLRDDGLFVITSCNWTEKELTEHFKDTFTLHKIIPTPQFKFGGQVGSVVTSAVFKKI